MSKRKLKNPKLDSKNWRQKIREHMYNRDISKAASSCIQFLKSEPEDAIKFINREIMDRYIKNGNYKQEIPSEFHRLFLEVAKYYSSAEQYVKALEVLESIKDSDDEKINKKVKITSDVVKLAQEMSKEKEEISEETIENIVDNLEKDTKENEDTKDAGSYIDLLLEHFGKDFSIDKLDIGELEKIIDTSGWKKPDYDPVDLNDDSVSPNIDREYSEELSSENRIKFFKENFNLEPSIRFCMKGIFSGSVLLRIKDSDLVIVEKLFDINANKTYVKDRYGSSATYILPKDEVLELIKLQTKKQIKDKKPENNKIKTINHTKNYYINLIKRFEEAQNEMLFSESEEIEKDTTLEEKDTEDKENVKEQKKYKVKPGTKKPEKILKENREFLGEINNILGGIIKPELIEELLKRASYSFENLYNNKLKDKLYEKLGYIETPEDKLEEEAKKVFIYIRITNNMSMINSSNIKGEELSELLDQAVVEYDKGMEFLEKYAHMNLTLKEIKKAMKEYVAGNDILKNEDKTEESKILGGLETTNEIDESDEQVIENADKPEKNNEQEVIDVPIIENADEPEENKIQEELEDVLNKQILDSENETEESAQELDEQKDDVKFKNPSIGEGKEINLVVLISAMIGRVHELDIQLKDLKQELETVKKEEEIAKQNAQERLEEQKQAEIRAKKAIQEQEEATKLAQQAKASEEDSTNKRKKLESKIGQVSDESEGLKTNLSKIKEMLE